MAGGLDLPIDHDHQCAGEAGDCQRQPQPRPEARGPMKQEIRIPAVPDDDVLRECVSNFRVEAVKEDVRRQERRRIDEREHRDRRSGRTRKRGIVAPQRCACGRCDERQQAGHRKQHGADIFGRCRETDHDPEHERPAQLGALTQPVERGEGEQQPRRQEDVFLEQLGVDRNQRRCRRQQAGGERKTAPYHAACEHDRRQHRQSAEYGGDRTPKSDHRDLVGVPGEQVGEADRLQQQQGLEKILPAFEDEIGFLGLVRLRGERQVGDGVVGERGHGRERAGCAPIPDLRAAPVQRKVLQPGCHQQRICGTMTGPLTRASGASHDAHWRTKPGPGYSYL